MPKAYGGLGCKMTALLALLELQTGWGDWLFLQRQFFLPMPLRSVKGAIIDCTPLI
jgi:hypothetical protein